MLNQNQSYSDKLKDVRWQKRRLEILNRDQWKCTLCGDDKSQLHVHHEKYTGEPWDAPNRALKTVCEDCHGLLHNIKDLDYVAKVLKIKNNMGDCRLFACDPFSVESQTKDSDGYHHQNSFSWSIIKELHDLEIEINCG